MSGMAFCGVNADGRNVADERDLYNGLSAICVGRTSPYLPERAFVCTGSHHFGSVEVPCACPCHQRPIPAGGVA